MEIIGANVGETTNRVFLKEGSTTSISEGNVAMSIPEDRVSRVKYQGGFEKSFEFILSRRSLNISEIDRIYLSTLGEEVGKNLFQFPSVKKFTTRYPLLASRIRPTGSHHLNHAYSVFPFSDFDDALIVVADMEGSIIGKKIHNEHWKNRLERVSYYLAKKDDNSIRIKLLEREFDEEDIVGPGEMYGIFTHFCGFNSYTDSGKTMGLAAYGDNRFSSVRLFGRDKNTGKAYSYLNNNYYESSKEINRYLEYCGFPGIAPARLSSNPTKESAALALLVQRETERIIIEGIERIRKKYRIKTRNICFAGGIALNCTLNSRIIIDGVADRLFLQPACGDTGQSLGAATYGYYKEEFEKKKTHPVLESVFLTGEYKEEEIFPLIEKADLRYKKVDNIATEAAALIAKGSIVGWFQGRGELGPRALGARSILANPCVRQIKNILNSKIKHRESFRPFAPVCIEEKATKYFDINTPSPYMLLAPEVKKPFNQKFSSITHIDGSARLQTVSKHDQPLFHSLLSEFEKITGYPVMINTSLNDGGEPLVESPSDAIKCFIKTGLDYLVIQNYIISK